MDYFALVPLVIALFIISLAARQMGDIFARFKLPLISGFLFVGILVGPFLLDFVHSDNVPQLLPLDELSLAFIAFAAGAELESKVIQGYFRSIISLIGGQVVVVLVLGIAAFFLVAGQLPFMASLPTNEVLAIGLLGATIMIARSPSSALAIIKELRARGPFTHKVLGATVLMDAVVIVIFAASVSFAAVLTEGASFEPVLLLFVGFEVLVDIALGLLVGVTLRLIMRLPYDALKGALILLLGLAVFTLSNMLHEFHPFSVPVGLFSEPLLICMAAGFYVTNYTRFSAEFQHLLERMSPAVFLLFFTLVGIELELDVIRESWGVILILFAVRFVAIFFGSFAGVAVARDRSPGFALLGFGFITQAGVSIGLAKEIGVEFAGWGPQLATLSIGVIVISQIVGPPMLKWAINRVGEAHTRAPIPAFDGVRDVTIFGVEGQSLALARQLIGHQWQVTLVAQNQAALNSLADASLDIRLLPEISVAGLAELNIGRAESVVLMFSDDENYAICELIYEHFGVGNVVVRIHDMTKAARFHELAALVVEPGTAIVTLLDQFVRSPFAASLLLGTDPEEEFMELEMNNGDLSGVAVRDIHFPPDVLIVSILRKGERLLSHGYTRLEIGDHLTVVGTPESLLEVQVRFEA